MITQLKNAFRALSLLVLAGIVQAAERPNILWITSEDNSPYLGCYSDTQAETPRLDGLAAEGVRYRNAFANAPVCSSARSTLITGMYATSVGVQHHRSRVQIPAQFELYPVPLRKAGYYCTNNAKTDYNVANAGKPWDESSPQAHYKNRRPGQPFLAVFNITSTHESSVAPKGDKPNRLRPEDVKLPPYHPDTDVIRRDWANYYDQMSKMDAQVGQLLDELEKSGLADDTIVFYHSDHGGGLPRGKRNLHDSGTRVPLIVRFPKRWQHFAPAAPGEWVDQCVSFVDLPATMFSLCGVPLPQNYEGRSILGESKTPPREYVFLYRGRMDERYDHVRAIRDSQFRYLRNYNPHLACGQHYEYPFKVLPSMRSWYDEFAAGRCDAVQAAYWQPRAAEELYDLASDPFETKNLVGDPKYAERASDMRRKLHQEMIATRDTGFIPEGMFVALAGDKTVYDYVQSEAYPIERILALADKATGRDASYLPDLISALDDPHPVVRYWGAMGCLILQAKASPAQAKLRERLKDPYADVRIAAAQALGYSGAAGEGAATLAEVLHKGNQYEILAAQNAVEAMWRAGQIPLDRTKKLVTGVQDNEPLDRIPRYLLSLP